MLSDIVIAIVIVAIAAVLGLVGTRCCGSSQCWRFSFSCVRAGAVARRSSGWRDTAGRQRGRPETTLGAQAVRCHPGSPHRTACAR